MERIEEMFGELRSLLQRGQSEVTRQWREELNALLERAWASNEASYRATWIPYLQRYFQQLDAPVVLRWVDGPEQLSQWGQMLPFACLGLDYCGYLFGDEPEDLSALLESPYLSAALELNLVQSGIGDENIGQVLQREEALGSLWSLMLENNRGLGCAGVEALSRSSILSSLRYLGLSGTLVANAGIRALASSPYLSELKTLSLIECSIGPGAAIAIGESSSLRSLRILHLDWNPVRPVGVEALASSEALSELEVLSLSRCSVEGDGLRALARSTTLRNLRELHLFDNALGPEAVIALAQASWPGSLRRLDLSGNPIGEAGARALAEAPLLAGLESLTLDRDQITAQGARALASSPYLCEEIRQKWRGQ